MYWATRSSPAASSRRSGLPLCTLSCVAFDELGDTLRGDGVQVVQRDGDAVLHLGFDKFVESICTLLPQHPGPPLYRDPARRPDESDDYGHEDSHSSIHHLHLPTRRVRRRPEGRAVLDPLDLPRVARWIKAGAHP